ncbi:hypothetical protein GCM10010412_026360 [Nonomuraea recticatena]|uniref:Uncharacterized protein n=1 Tax=Nonomuraea recticatena TaxID=46178 RepID=A0ABP6DZM9_9ACTN
MTTPPTWDGGTWAARADALPSSGPRGGHAHLPRRGERSPPASLTGQRGRRRLTQREPASAGQPAGTPRRRRNAGKAAGKVEVGVLGLQERETRRAGTPAGERDPENVGSGGSGKPRNPGGPGFRGPGAEGAVLGDAYWGEEGVEEADGACLVEGLVAVAALG